jgi:hypothetical protein
MKKVIIILFLMFLVFSIFVHAEKVAVITEVLKPTTLAVDDDRFYVTEGATIFIYSLMDYKLIKKFGREGQGPQEFAVIPELPIMLNVYTEDIIVNSFGKVSYFTKEGIFKKEVRTKGIGWLFSPLEKGYIGFGRTIEDKVAYDVISFYDATLSRGKEIARNKIGNPEKKLELLKRSLNYQVHDHKIFVTGAEGFVIDVLDHTGNKLHSITQEYDRVKFNPKIEELFRDGLKKRNPQQYDFLKNRLEFPDYFPEILNFFIDVNKIYVATWKWEKDKIEFFIFDLKGKLLKHQFISFALQEDGMTPYPPAIKDGKLYQLIENEEEDWELHVSKID